MISRDVMVRALACTTMFAQPALAQEAQTEGAEVVTREPVGSDIVVTATRRESRLQTTPLAVTAVGSDELATRGISNVEDLTMAVPGLSFGQNLGQAHIAIRGVGADNVTTGQDPRVAYYQDSVYIGRSAAQLGGFFDVERVEVLKGPQGALYGRNATGGAISVISAAPTTSTRGYVRLQYGNYADRLLEAAYGGPVSDTLSFRAAVRANRRDGYGQNLLLEKDIDDRDEYAGRLSLLWQPTANLSFLTVGDYSRQNDNAFGLHLIGRGNPNVPLAGVALGGLYLLKDRDVFNNTQPTANTKIYGIRETITLDADWGTLTSITAFRKSSTEFLTDFDATSLDLSFNFIREYARQFSQEIQVAGDIESFNWLVGALYFNERIRARTNFPFNSILTGGANSLRQGFFSGGNLNSESIAPYFRVGYEIAPRLNISAGGRFTYEKKSIDDTFMFDFSRPFDLGNAIIPVQPFPRSADVTYRKFSPSATVDYQFSDAVFGYLTYSEGFKSGGYAVGVNAPPFEPEVIKNIELGIKTTSLGGRLRANFTVFHYDYANLQVSIVRGTQARIENAASAKVNGVEFETTIGPFSGFTFNGSATYLDSKYKNYVSINPIFIANGPQDLNGNQLTQSPKFSVNLSGQKSWELGNGELVARTEYHHVSRIYFTPFNQQNISQEGFGLLSGSVAYRSNDGWSIDAYIKNAANKLAVAQSFVGTPLLGFPNVGVLIPPRTYGIKISYEF